MIIIIPINNVKLQTIIHIINTLKKPSFLHITAHTLFNQKYQHHQ